MRRYFYQALGLFLIFSLQLGTTYAQSIDFELSVPTATQVCASSEEFTIEFANNTGAQLNQVRIQVDFPIGLQYNGKLREFSNFNVVEHNMSDLTAVVFRANDLPDGQSIEFQFEGTAGAAAITHQQNGNVFRNLVTVSHLNGSANQQTEAYNILYPELSIQEIDPMVVSVNAGETYTRTVKILNGGFGRLSTFTLKEVYDTDNLELLSSNLGTLNDERDEVVLSNSDFESMGNGDTWLDQNEAVELELLYRVVGCSNSRSEMYTFWACDNTAYESDKKLPRTNVRRQNPNLKVRSVSDFDYCVSGEAYSQRLVLENTGVGNAYNIVVDVKQVNSRMFTRVDVNSIEYSVNGGPFMAVDPVVSYEAVSTGIYACLGPDAKRGFLLNLPSITTGDIYEVRWDHYTCPTEHCGNTRLSGWNYKVTYEDACFSQTFNKNGKGAPVYDKDFSLFIENTSDLLDGEEGSYLYTLNKATMRMPSTGASYVKLAFELPRGLRYNSNSDQLTFSSGPKVWEPTSIAYHEPSGTLVATYPLPLPFNLRKSSITLNLEADCGQSGATDGLVDINMQLFYIMDGSCDDPYELPLSCKETVSTYLHCLDYCEEGMLFESFEVVRTSFGAPDNDQDGLPDESGSLNTDLVKSNRLMVGDTFKAVFRGEVNSLFPGANWNHAYARNELMMGDTFELIGAEVLVKTANGRLLYCDQVLSSTSVFNDLMTAEFDFSSLLLGTVGCTDFFGYQYQDRDEIILTAHYRVRGNIGGKIEQVNITGDMYLSRFPNPGPDQQLQCGTWSGNMTLAGYFFRSDKTNNYNVNGCTRKVQQNYYLSIGSCCTNYAGGDLFPYEYRHWATVKDLEINIPEGYRFRSADISQKRTKHANGITTENQEITPISIDGNNYIFDLEEALVENGGKINRSDDGFHGTVSVIVEPDCNLPIGENREFDWSFNFQKGAAWGGDKTEEFIGLDRLKYNRADLVLQAEEQTVNGLNTTVTWEVTVRNMSNKVTANNAFIVFESPSTNVEVLYVQRASNGSNVPVEDGIFQLGRIRKNASASFLVTASFGQCETDELVAYLGYDCEGYPTALEDIQCGYSEQLPVFVNPVLGDMQARVDRIIQPDPCTPKVEIELEIISTKAAGIKDIVIGIDIPASHSVLLTHNAISVEYPVGSGFKTTATPDLNGYTYTLTGADLNADLDANGLSGTGDLTRNTLKVRLAAEVQSHFETGDIIAISVDAKSTCGQDLSTINLNVDPVETFGRTTSIGLDDLSNNWSMSWVDFDVDGDVDIFLTNYDINQPNQLLENRGNGEFSPVTEGALVTDLIGVSQGAAWGDYNNDGLPDVYITNNIGATNALYRNLGDGNFVRIQGDPSVAYDGYSFGTSWADYDNDGYLDLFVAEFFASRFNKLFHNNGDGTFTEVNDAAIVFEAASSVNGFWADYDNDGDQDLFVVNHQGENNSLYRNDGNGQFTPMTESVVANDGGKSVGASWGDIDNDRDLDLFVANAGNEDNFLYTNNGDGTFTKVLSGPVVSGGGHSHGSAFGDIDNDGDLDLVVTNDSQQDNALYSNNGDGEFVETFNPISEEGGESFGSALGDYDNDGDLDLFIANHGENVNFFYENGRGQCQSSICINLVGVNSNRTGVGARISVLATINGFPTWQIREVSTQTGGLSSQGELRQLFGLGDAAQVDSIVVEWPSGHTQTMGSQPLGDCMEIEESGGALLMGTVYFDENIDCIKGNAEQRLANAEIIIEPINERVYTDDLGQFSVYLPLGNYVVSINPPSHWVANCTGLRHSVVLDDIDQIITDLDFGFEPSVDCENMPDLGVQVSSTAMRVGFDGLSAIYYQNIGTATAYDVTLEVDYPADMTLLEGTIPWDSVAGNTYFWFMDSLAIGQAITAYNKFFVDSTSTVGDSVSTLARINSANRDCNLDNNIYDERVELQGAIDPNDILVSPEGLIDAGEELTYKIRFQNIGTVAARNVRIENELPEEVDINSLVLGLASHPYRFQLLDDRKLVWYFDFINLPDSTSDLLGSQGFVSYKVKSKANLPAETEFGNDAQIYFDNLEPIQTNIVYNIIRNNNVDDSTQGSLLIYPNPALRSDEITIQLNPAEWGLERRIDRIEVFNNQGQLIREQRSINEESYQLDAEHFGPGIFWIRIQGVDGKTYQDRVIFM